MPRAFSIAILVAGLVVAAGAGHAADGDDPDQPTLSAKDLAKYFAPYVPAVKQCYADNGHGPRADGSLRLELVIHRDGSVFRFGFVAAGVRGAWLRRLDKCLRKLSESWHFPVRAGFTTAVLPFQFQRITAPGAGPIVHCPDPRGCPPKPEPGRKP
jgi:hypothetical protein